MSLTRSKEPSLIKKRAEAGAGILQATSLPLTLALPLRRSQRLNIRIRIRIHIPAPAPAPVPLLTSSLPIPINHYRRLYWSILILILDLSLSLPLHCQSYLCLRILISPPHCPRSIPIPPRSQYNTETTTTITRPMPFNTSAPPLALGKPAGRNSNGPLSGQIHLCRPGMHMV